MCLYPVLHLSAGSGGEYLERGHDARGGSTLLAVQGQEAGSHSEGLEVGVPRTAHAFSMTFSRRKRDKCEKGTAPPANEWHATDRPSVLYVVLPRVQKR